MLQIVLDSRESRLQQELNSRNYPFVQEELVVGDIIIKDIFKDVAEKKEGEEDVPDKILLIIERKTIDDLLGGVKSGRYREQRERLKSTGCKCIYILENYDKLSLTESTEFAIVSGTIENLVLYHGIPVIPTVNIQHTAKTIINIIDKYSKELPNYLKSVASVVPVFTQKKTKVLEHIHEHQLILVPGVSVKSAQAIAKKYPTVKSLTSAFDSLEKPEEKWNLLADISVGKKKLGKVVSKRIFEIYGL